MKVSAPAIITSREVIIAGYDAILDQSDQQNLYNHLSNYTKYIYKYKFVKLHHISFLYQIFKEDANSATVQAGSQVAESILRLFPGFDAFMLPPPSCKPEDLRRINQDRSNLNSDFLSGLEDFKRLLKTTLAPKNSINGGEFVTGEGIITYFWWHVLKLVPKFN